MGDEISPTTGAVVLPSLQTLQPTDADGYLIAARHMLAGAKPLAVASPVPIVAMTMLCGHGSEAALKAMLSKAGIGTNALKKLGHDLVGLWNGLAAYGIGSALPPPQWLEQLHHVHAAPYYLRYPIGLHGVSLPGQVEMLAGFENLVLTAESMIRS